MNQLILNEIAYYKNGSGQPSFEGEKPIFRIKVVVSDVQDGVVFENFEINPRFSYKEPETSGEFEITNIVIQ